MCLFEVVDEGCCSYIGFASFAPPCFFSFSCLPFAGRFRDVKRTLEERLGHGTGT